MAPFAKRISDSILHPLRKLSAIARASIRDAVSVIDELYGKSSLFATGTCPGSSPQAVRAFARLSSDIHKLTTQWIRDTAPGARYTLVWEFQKRGALHLHIAIGVYGKRVRRVLQRTFKRYWIGMLKRLGAHAGVDLFERADGGSWKDNNKVVKARIEVIKKSVARYMSKYLSKGVADNGSYVLLDGSSPISPKRWYSVSSALARDVRARTKCHLFNQMDGYQTVAVFERAASMLVRLADVAFCFPGKVYESDITVVAFTRMEGADRLFGLLKASADVMSAAAAYGEAA